MRDPNLLPIREAAKICVLSEYSLRKMAKANVLPCVYSGSKCLVDMAKLRERLDFWASNPGSQPRL